MSPSINVSIRFLRGKHYIYPRYLTFVSFTYWNGVHSALVRVNEELLERKVAAPV
jgi:hypothetical protein